MVTFVLTDTEPEQWLDILKHPSPEWRARGELIKEKYSNKNVEIANAHLGAIQIDSELLEEVKQ